MPGLSSASGTTAPATSSGPLGRTWQCTGAGKAWGAAGSLQRVVYGVQRQLERFCSDAWWSTVEVGEELGVVNCDGFSGMVIVVNACRHLPLRLPRKPALIWAPPSIWISGQHLLKYHT